MEKLSVKNIKEVPVQLDKLETLLTDLDMAVNFLEEQLAPILSRNQVTQVEEDQMKEQDLVPLGNVLRKRCKQVNAIIKRISYLHTGIQV